MPAHSHTYSGTTTGTGAHNHSLATKGAAADGTFPKNASDNGNANAIYTVGGGNHSHTYGGTTSSIGSGTSFDNRPPYYVLAFIMKL